VVPILLFIAGFATVFTALGAFTGAVTRALRSPVGLRVSGAIIAAFGLLLLLYALRLGRPSLFAERRPLMGRVRPGRAWAFPLGVAFGAGWTPCIGPVLATVLTVAANEASLGAGVRLLFVYSLGLGIPFILAAVAIGPFLGFMQRFKRHLGRVEMVMGLLLVLTGVLVLTGGLNWFGTWMIEAIPALGRIEEFFTPKGLQTEILKEGAR
jgi:cytochrome c-type biogenesis protein